MIHPTALIGEPPQMRTWQEGDPLFWPQLGEGVRIGALTVVDSGYHSPTIIGARTWLMCQTHVGHDTVIGEDCQIATGTVIGGYATIGDRTKLGVNVTVLPLVKIGSDCQIGSGSVVVKDVPDGETWVGNPARKIERKSTTTIAAKYAAQQKDD